MTVGAPLKILQPASSTPCGSRFSVVVYSVWASPLSDVVFPSFPLSTSSSPSLNCSLLDSLGQPRWSCDVRVPFQFASFHWSQEVFTRPMAFPNLAFTPSLAMWSLYKMLRNLRKHLISSAFILLSMSAVMVHVSHAYKNTDMARERISVILEVMVMFLSFQMTFSFVTATVVWAILDSTSGLDPPGSLNWYYR